jgi:hypothetical protein
MMRFCKISAVCGSRLGKHVPIQYWSKCNFINFVFGSILTIMWMIRSDFTSESLQWINRSDSCS